MKAEFGPELRKKCFQHLLPQKNQGCQLLFSMSRGCALTDHGRGFLAPAHTMPGVGSKGPPALVLVSRHQGVLPLLPGNSSLRNPTVLASEETKDTTAVSKG